MQRGIILLPLYHRGKIVSIIAIVYVAKHMNIRYK